MQTHIFDPDLKLAPFHNPTVHTITFTFMTRGFHKQTSLADLDLPLLLFPFLLHVYKLRNAIHIPDNAPTPLHIL